MILCVFQNVHLLAGMFYHEWTDLTSSMTEGWNSSNWLLSWSWSEFSYSTYVLFSYLRSS